MARGQIAKAEVAKKILETFSNSFNYNDGKEIRIPCLEDGETIQIKVTLTAAKENVNPGDDTIIPGNDSVIINPNIIEKENKKSEPTQEELNNVNELFKALGL